MISTVTNINAPQEVIYYVTFGAMASLADSLGILGTAEFKSSASLSALMNGATEKKIAIDTWIEKIL